MLSLPPSKWPRNVRGLTITVFGTGLFVLALHLVALGVAFRAIRISRTPQSAVGWVLFLGLLPYVALPLWLFLGHTRYPGYLSARRLSKASVARLFDCRQRHAADVSPEEPNRHLEGFERLAGMPITSGNACRLLVDGEETFGAILAAIDRAESYVLVQSYIIRDDRIGRDLKESLIRKAREDCVVRLLYDAIGSYSLPDRFLQDLRAAGVVCANFHSIRRPHSRFQINFRNHRKIVVVDGETGFVGGLNVGDEYMSRDLSFGHWRDTHLAVRGPIVAQLQLIFAEDWNWATEERLQLAWEPSPQPQNLTALVLGAGPADEMETGSLYFCNAINAARKRIWIASAYFVPDIDIISALALAALRGVEVRVLVPDKRDHLFVWLAGFAYCDELREAGVAFYRYLDGFMHQKVILVDDELASVGSLNLDNRSCRLNFEVTAIVWDVGFAREVEAMLLEDFARSEEYKKRLDDLDSPLKRFGAPVARLMAPLL